MIVLQRLARSQSSVCFSAYLFLVLMLTACAPRVVEQAEHVAVETGSLLPTLPACDHTIGPTVVLADGEENYAQVQPGDVVCIAAGARQSLKLRNFHGSAEAPIQFINSGGTVVIQGDPYEHAGIDIRYSDHLHLTGTGTPARCGAPFPVREQQCGIVIIGGVRGVAGSDETDSIQVDHIEVDGPSKMGIVIKSNDKYGTHRSEWTQEDTYLHHNYLHDIGTEGFYIGSSFYRGGDDPVLKNVEISYNLVIRTGWDGLQVGSAVENCTIHHNYVSWAGKAVESNQQSGIMNNPGSVCHIYNNAVFDSIGPGIYLQGNGGNRVYNNVIVRPGRLQPQRGDGIAVINGSNQDRDIFIWNNTIVQPERYGIRFRDERGDNHQIYNNIIVNSHADKDDDGSSRESMYINRSDGVESTLSNNLYVRTVIAAGFADPSRQDFSLLPDSPAVDAGADFDSVEVAVDYLDVVRPQGKRPDVGAYEHVP